MATEDKNTGKTGKVLTQNDINTIIQARISNLLNAIEKIAMKAATTETAQAAVQNIQTSLENFAGAMSNENINKAFKGLWFKFFRFERQIKKLVRYTNKLYEITKDSEPGVKAIATISFIVEHVAKTIDSLKNIQAPLLLGIKLKRVNNILKDTHVLIETITTTGTLIKSTTADVKGKMVAKFVETLKSIMESISGVHKVLFAKVNLLLIKGILRLIQWIVIRVARMRRLTKALMNIIKLKMFFYNLAELVLVIVLVAPAFVLAPLAMIAILLTMGVFWMLMKFTNWVLTRIARLAVRSMLKMAIIVLALGIMAVTFIILALVAKDVVINSIWILAFLGIVILAVLLIGAIGWVVNMCSGILGQAIGGLILVMIMVGVLTGLALMLNMISSYAKNITDNFETTMLMLGEMALIILALVPIGFGGILAGVAALFMPGNMVLVGQFYLLFLMVKEMSETKLNMDNVRKNIYDVEEVIGLIEDNFCELNFFNSKADDAEYSLIRVRRLVRQIKFIIYHLNTIQQFKLKKRAIKRNIDLTWRVVDQIESELNNHVDPVLVSGGFWKRWKARAAARRKANAGQTQLKRVKHILNQIHQIIKQLNKIQTFKLDGKAIKNVIKNVFDVVDQIEKYLMKGFEEPQKATTENIFGKWIANYRERKRQREIERAKWMQRFKSRMKINRAEKILSQIKSMTDVLDSIMEISIDKTTIIDKLSKIFSIVDDIDAFIINKSKLPEKDKNEFANWYENYRQIVTENWQAAQTNAKFDRVSAMLVKVKSMLDVFKELNKIKFTGTKLKAKLNKIFLFNREIFDMVMNGDMMPEEYANARKRFNKEYIKNTNANWEDIKRMDSEFEWQFNHANIKLGQSDSVLQTVMSMVEKYRVINKFKFNADKTKEKVKLIFSSSRDIFDIVMKEDLKDIETDEFQDKFATFFDLIKQINTTLSSTTKLSAKQANLHTKVLRGYGEFIGKINTIDIEKVETTANLFEKMADFSESIHGDFEQLADAISEKLLPLIEDLKEVMGVIPEKLENGFANTSASIAATAAPATEENVTAQVNRENPNMSKEEIEKLVQSRLSERAQSDANGIVAKLDDIMSILNGSRGYKVPVTIR